MGRASAFGGPLGQLLAVLSLGLAACARPAAPPAALPPGPLAVSGLSAGPAEEPVAPAPRQDSGAGPQGRASEDAPVPLEPRPSGTTEPPTVAAPPTAPRDVKPSPSPLAAPSVPPPTGDVGHGVEPGLERREDRRADPAVTETTPRSPHVGLQLGAIAFENGEVPKADRFFQKKSPDVVACVAKHGGMRGPQAKFRLEFLVRSRGRAEGVELTQVSGAADALDPKALECMRLVFKNSWLGTPSAEPVGLTVPLLLEPRP